MADDPGNEFSGAADGQQAMVSASVLKGLLEERRNRIFEALENRDLEGMIKLLGGVPQSENALLLLVTDDTLRAAQLTSAQELVGTMETQGIYLVVDTSSTWRRDRGAPTNMASLTTRAAELGYGEFMEPLARMGFDLTAPDMTGRTPVTVAAENSNGGVLSHLERDCGVNIDDADERGQTVVGIINAEFSAHQLNAAASGGEWENSPGWHRLRGLLMTIEEIREERGLSVYDVSELRGGRPVKPMSYVPALT